MFLPDLFIYDIFINMSDACLLHMRLLKDLSYNPHQKDSKKGVLLRYNALFYLITYFVVRLIGDASYCLQSIFFKMPQSLQYASFPSIFLPLPHQNSYAK